ncbi:LemA family protein [Candidatus Sumerlaeota bacterium]|nr:LemA family protein [Candidatus Sumerlaeota bacterium]
MMGPSVGLLIVLGIAVLIVIMVIGMYNGLVQLRQRVRAAWSQIDVQLKRRHDLIPNLVETVKGYAGHEKTTLEEVVKARSAAVDARGVAQQAEAEKALSGALSRLLVIVEQYPDLKANQNFLSLQEELTSTENKIGFSRQNYNDETMNYNTKIQQFPSNILAGMFGFKEEAYFEMENKAERETPQVKF